MPEPLLSTLSPLPVLLCPKCGHVGTPYVTPGTGPHVARATCRHCEAFLRWLPRRLVDPPPVQPGKDR
jgi:hypothetical protein